MTAEEHLFFMEEAIKEAEKAAAIGEVPIGAVVVCNGEIVGRGIICGNGIMTRQRMQKSVRSERLAGRWAPGGWNIVCCM